LPSDERALSIVYCIDTSALVDLKRLYPLDIFPLLWKKLDDLIQKGRLIAPDRVLKELERRDDELLAWVKARKQMFKEISSQHLRLVSEIVAEFPDLVDVNKDTEEADPFVISLVMAENEPDQKRLFNDRYVVVTQEKRRRGTGRNKMPDICDAKGIPCLNLLDLFREEKWRM
jgi:hypothetical protein